MSRCGSAGVRGVESVAGDELFAEPLEAAPDARVEEPVADPDGQPSDQRFVDSHLELDGRARHRTESLLEGHRLVGGQRRRARDDRRNDAVVTVEEPAVLGRDLRHEVEAAALRKQPDEVLHRRSDAGAEQLVDRRLPLGVRTRRVVDDADDPLVADEGGDGREVLAPRVDRAIALGELEGSLGVAARRRRRSRHQPVRPSVVAASRRNSSTSRRCRASVIVSPTTLPAAARARSATSARRSASARCFSASMSAVARSRIRSSSCRVAAMSASRVSWATRWARLMMSFASRRASCSAASRSCSAASRSRRAWSASSRPCAIRARRSASMPLTLFPNAWYSRTAKTMKFSAATMTQKKLIWRPAAAGSSAASATVVPVAPPRTARRSTLRTPLALLQDESEDRDDDREHAEAFGERRAEDELGANGGRRVRVAADCGRGEAGQDPDADAGADDPEGREAGADWFHCL